ncbi:uncharacterized protein BDFB_002499, partial [Asbolus verrucosus]
TGVYFGSTEGSRGTRTEHPGGTIVNDKLVFSKLKSPYWLRNDIIIERNAELIIEPGVTIHVEPQVGITVRGVLTARGTENERIVLTTAEESSARNINFPDIRLSDGPTILAGRLQLRHNGRWRSVCTNSKNWTRADMETACRQLGFQGGSFFNWFDRQMPLKPRLLYEEPKCVGTESSVFDCQWETRQLGSGVCDYHPDLAIQCLPHHDQPLPFWRGIKFENAKYNRVLTLGNTLYVPTSLSKLHYVHILYAGAGRNQNTSSALDVQGTPPLMDHLEIVNSAYNGINITKPDGPFTINNCVLRSNRGYGIFINSSYGLSHLDGCVISENGGDGVRFVHAEERPDERADRSGYNDFCNLAMVSSQTFPLQLFAEQTIFSNQDKWCDKVFTTRSGNVITLNILRAVTDRNNTATIEVYDGSSLNHRPLTKFSIRNYTRPQSLTSTGNQIFIKFRAQMRTNTVVFMRLYSGLSKSYDLNVSNSDISENIGRGVAVDNLRSQIHVCNSSVSKNQHVAGVHVTSGAGDVNVTDSRISFNNGDGINITYTGGSRNISKSSISSNEGYEIVQNYFINNSGIFVANLALSPYAQNQFLLFTRNFVKNNRISEPFQPEDGSISNLNPRSRVAAPIVVGSDNVDIFRNIVENPDSKYEIGSHLEDQSKSINCTYNWIGFSRDENILPRLFHRFDRYNLAKINFIPFLLHNSNPLTNRIYNYQLYVPKFYNPDSYKVGGEVEGEESLTRGEYIVEKDINIRPGGKLTIEPGVTLRFPPSVGMMVGGKLEARGTEPDSIKFTLKEEIAHLQDNDTYEMETEKYDSETEIIQVEPKVPIRLLGGATETEGRLQVKINQQWGTVCNYGWTIKNAALVCQQLGYVLNPDDWYLERNEIPSAGTAEDVILTNVQCDDIDLDITKCKAETKDNFENSCTHENDVGVRCYKTSWAGVRFGALAETSNIQYMTVEKAGLLDYATSTFKPALQIDFARHNFENIRISNNFYHGLGVVYADIFNFGTVNKVKNSEFSNNRGAGISLKQFGVDIFGSSIENNVIGIKHNPVLTGLQQRELAGWFLMSEEVTHYKPFLIPFNSDQNSIQIQRGETKYLVTSRIIGENISKSYKIRSDPGWVIGIQLLNPIENRSTESIVIQDANSQNNKSVVWILKRDLTIFPTTSNSHGIILDYNSGNYAIGGTVIVISAIIAPIQNIYNRIVKGPIPALTVKNSKIRNNQMGVQASYYNRYLNELGDHFLRKANESFQFINCEISHNRDEAIFIHSPHWDLHRSNISEIKLMINHSLITDNGKGIYQFSRDMRASNNIFHYVLQDVTIERNRAGGFDVSLPYVWQYNENFTHSIYMDNNTWTNNKKFTFNIDGHFAIVNITRNRFTNNKCATGLISIGGMEKKLLISRNVFNNNHGKYIIEFISNSQSEIIGEVPALFVYNELRNNQFGVAGRSFGILQMRKDPTCVVAFGGIQKVNVNRNLFSQNQLDYQLIAGIKTAKINNFLNVRENWWGSPNENEIKEKIFDFDDWNNHAIADFRPYLVEDNFESSYSVSFTSNDTVNLNKLGGRLTSDLVLPYRREPYIIQSDITVMPKVTLTISSGVEMEFGPNVGILVLGTLKAQGYQGSEIKMRPISKSGYLTSDDNPIIREKRQVESFSEADSIRLCQGRGCYDGGEYSPRGGFLEYFNKTTLQWIPMCDSRFTERNAQVVCRELGFDPLNAFFAHDIRIEFHSNSLSRIWSWPEPLQCKGTEKKYEDCPIRLNGQQFGNRHRCRWNSKFVFIHCGQKNLERKLDYWGGIRFANPEFEQQLYAYRMHDVQTHSIMQNQESVLEYVHIMGAGILHNEKSPAIQSIIKSPKINYVQITKSASHGINLVSPSNTMNLLHNSIEDSLGVGINTLSLTGEGRESDESSFTPLQSLNIPYNLFSLVDICDTHKEIRIDERVLLYYKYDNHPVNCIKIFKSAYNIKPLGFRLLQFNLFNSTVKYGIPDFISLYDGDIYNITSTLIGHITMNSHNEKKLFKTKLPSLSIKLFANGASSNHGFIAEVVTLPISAIGFKKELCFTCQLVKYNCEKLYGNFTTCNAAVEIDIQNTQTIFFRNNLVEGNQGGLSIKADSRGSATSLKGYIHNNLFVNNSNLPVLYVEGRQSSPYQEVIIYRNYFTRNHAKYFNNIVLKQVVSNFTLNYVKRNIGLQNLEVSGFDKVRLPIYQTTSHNGFYHNYAVHRDSRSTIVAGTAGQRYVDNIFFNPDNDYEMITVNRSLTLQLWNTKIDAAYNYWGLNSSLAVRGRIKDQSDDPRLLEVNYVPYYMNNRSVLLNKKCPPGWDLVGGTCYTYIGAPMTFRDAKAFCQADNASMPYLLGNLNYIDLYDFLRSQQQWYLYSDRVWVQHIDRINECTMFAYQKVETDNCEQRNPFICEIGKLLCRSTRSTDTLTKGSDYKKMITTNGSLDSMEKSTYTSSIEDSQSYDIYEAHNPNPAAFAYSPTIEYHKSPNRFENQYAKPNGFELAYKNEGFRDNSTFATNSNYQSRAHSVQDSTNDETPIMQDNGGNSVSYPPSEYYNTDTLPLSTASGKSDSTLDLKKGIDEFNKNNRNYDPIYSRERPSANLMNELKNKLPKNPPPPPDPVPTEIQSPTYSEKLENLQYSPTPDYNIVGLAADERPPSANILETNFDDPQPKPKVRAKSEVFLETNFDYTPPGGSPQFNQPISEFSRSKSQPLETAM